MKNFPFLFIVIFLFSCQEKTEDKFPIIKEFDANKKLYKIDTIQLENISTEGGELILYFDKENEKSVLDFYVYGETGKLNYTYFTEKDFKYQFVIKKDYKYDKPITEKNLKVDSTINYINFEPIEKLYDQNGDEITNVEKLNSTISEIDTFFKQTLKNNVIIRK